MRQAEVNSGATHMVRSTSTATLALCSLFASFTPALAALPALGSQAASAHPAEKCLGAVKVAYLILSRGGLFGIDASYVPVPWNAMKAPPNASKGDTPC